MKAILIQAYLLCTSYFSLHLIWNEYLKTRPRSNIWKPGWKRADTCKIFTFFKISKIYACKIPLFVDFANSRLPFESCPFFGESGYERGIRFDREGGGVQVMAWCRQATSHYLSHDDPVPCRHIASLSHNELNGIMMYNVYHILSRSILHDVNCSYKWLTFGKRGVWEKNAKWKTDSVYIVSQMFIHDTRKSTCTN